MRLLRLLRPLAAAAVALPLLVLSGPVAGAAPAPSPVTWAVQPGDEHGPDGRAWAELTSKAGEKHTEHLVVRNLGREATTFSLKSADGYFTENGRFAMRTSGEASVDAGTWITAPESVTVPAGQQRVVPYTIAVPEAATPGDHAAAIAATITTAGTGADGNKMGVESRVGFRVMVRVNGEFAPALAATSSLEYSAPANPLGPGTARLQVNLENTGNTRLAAGGTVSITGPFGWGKREVPFPAVDDTLPGEKRSLSLDVGNVWPLFITFVDVTLQPAAANGQDLPTLPGPISIGTQTMTVPWGALSLAALLIAVSALIAVVRRRRRAAFQARLDRVREEAHEEGRLSVLAQANARESVGAQAWLPVLALALGAVVGGAPLTTAPPTEDSGVRVEVSISALGTATTSPTGTPTTGPSESPTAPGSSGPSVTLPPTVTTSPSGPRPSNGSSQSTTASSSGGLPETGVDVGALLPMALVLATAGALVWIVAARTRRRH